jgi:ABC-type transport system involved in multi-copper enzyme maturation permease subunit
MFRALAWKEWRQLALVRWGGIALGALLPIAFSAGAELAQRGLLPTGSVKSYAPRDLMFELLPAALALGVWPLIGLMSAASAFAGDRAAGTETFLLERPVPRASVWRARLLASVLTLVVVIVVTTAFAAAAAAIAGAPPGIGWLRWALLISVGVGVGLLAYVSGVVAASLLSSPTVAARPVHRPGPVWIATRSQWNE